MGSLATPQRHVAQYVTATSVLGMSCVYAATLLQLDLAPLLTLDFLVLGLASLVFIGAFLVLGRTSFAFTWRGHRHRMVLDEVALYVGFILLPTPLVVLLVAIAGVLEQVMMRRDALKAVFNLSQSVLGASVAALAYVGLASLGLDPIIAALPVAFLYPVTSNLLLAGVFSRLTGTRHDLVFLDRFLAPSIVAGAVGAGGGVAVAILWSVHPFTLLALSPFVFLTYRYGVLSALADRELEVRKRLAAIGHALVGTTDEAHAAGTLLEACGELLPSCGRAEMHLDHGRTRYHHDFAEGPDLAALPLDTPLSGATAGRSLGTLRILPRHAAAGIAEVERELVRLIASQAGAIVEATRALAHEEDARRRLEAYLRNAADAILLVAEGRITYTNDAAELLFGRLQDARLVDIFPQPERLLPHGDAPLLAEATTLAAEGRPAMVVEVHAAPLSDSELVGGTLLLVRDVTERKRLEEESVRQRDILARQEKLSALGTLVAGVAHEINNPVTYMKGALELARLDLDEVAEAAAQPETRASVEHARASIDRLAQGVQRVERITHSLKAVARQGNGERAPEDLNAIASDVAQVVGVALPERVRVETILAPSLSPVPANASEMHQVVLNLVKNAIEALAAHGGGTVRVRTREEEGRVILEVEDDGPGIPPEVQRRLFEPFFTTKRKGTGLGLSLSRGIAEAHGGELTLHSAPGVGTRFTLILPAA